MNDRPAWAVLGVLCLATLVAAWRLELGEFRGDAATYHGMAWSLAFDGDIQFEPRDLLRVQRETRSGPEGVFLKSATGGLTHEGVSGWPFLRRVTEERIYYAKPFLYPLAAAPLVRMLGTRGLYLLNALSLSAALLLGYAACRKSRTPGQSLALVLATFAGTVMPLYLVFIAPEMFYMGLAAAALALWRLGHPGWAAVLIGAAAYAKPPNIFLSIPILAAPLVEPGRPLRQRLLESTRRGVLVGVAGLLFVGWNVALTGEWNYQGGVRKTFYGRFPFEVAMVDGEPRKLTFGNTGGWMTTQTVGPEADEITKTETPRTEPPRPAAELRRSFQYNLLYFWIGRFGGVIPYFLPFAAAAGLFFVQAGRLRAGRGGLMLLGAAWAASAWLLPQSWYGGGHPMSIVLLACYALPALGAAFLWSAKEPDEMPAAFTMAALLVTLAFYLWLIPDNWYGNGSAGNRYFTTLVPLALFFAPRRREWLVAAAAVASVAFLVRPFFVAPLYHASRSQAVHATRGIFRQFPLELTMLNDVALFAEGWRKKQTYGDTGNEHKRWPAEPDAYWLYFPDDGTYGREAMAGREGFWLRGGREAEVILRAGLVSNRVHKIHADVTGGPAGDEVDVRAEGKTSRLTLAAGQTAAATFAAGRGLPYKETVLYVLRFRSSRGGSDPLGRTLGSFVRIRLDVERPRRW